MTEEKVIKVSDMIRVTAENQNTFLIQIADHIDKLEQAIDELRNRVITMEQANEPDTTAQ